MKKILFRNFNSSGYLRAETHEVEVIKMRLKQLGYFDIEVL